MLKAMLFDIHNQNINKGKQKNCEKIYTQVSYITYKTFSKVEHEELLEMWEELDLHGKDSQITCNLYWAQKACMWIENKFQ